MTTTTSRIMSFAIPMEKLKKVTYDLFSLWGRGSKWRSVGLKKSEDKEEPENKLRIV